MLHKPQGAQRSSVRPTFIKATSVSGVSISSCSPRPALVAPTMHVMALPRAMSFRDVRQFGGKQVGIEALYHGHKQKAIRSVKSFPRNLLRPHTEEYSEKS